MYYFVVCFVCHDLIVFFSGNASVYSDVSYQFGNSNGLYAANVSCEYDYIGSCTFNVTDTCSGSSLVVECSRSMWIIMLFLMKKMHTLAINFGQIRWPNMLSIKLYSKFIRIACLVFETWLTQLLNQTCCSYLFAVFSNSL